MILKYLEQIFFCLLSNDFLYTVILVLNFRLNKFDSIEGEPKLQIQTRERKIVFYFLHPHHAATCQHTHSYIQVITAHLSPLVE